MQNFQSTEKRQKFRISIRNRQIYQKFNLVRQQHNRSNKFALSQLQQIYMNMGGHQKNTIKQICDLFTLFIRQLQIQYPGEQEDVGKIGNGGNGVFWVMLELLIDKLQQILRYGQSSHLDNDLNKQILTISISQTLQTHKKQIQTLQNPQTQPFDQPQQQHSSQPYNQQQTDCQPGQPNNQKPQQQLQSYQQTHHHKLDMFKILQQNHTQFHHNLNNHIICQTTKIVRFLHLLRVQMLPVWQICMICGFCWRMLEAVDVPDCQDGRLEDDVVAYQQLLTHVFGFFNFVLAAIDPLSKQTLIQHLVKLQVFTKLRYIIDFLVQSHKHHHQLNFQLLTNSHTKILQFLPHTPKQTISAQHTCTYLLYLLSSPLPLPLLHKTLSLLVSILHENVELPALIDNYHYVNLLQIMRNHFSGNWNADNLCVVYAVVKMFGDAVRDCEEFGRRVIVQMGGLQCILDLLKIIGEILNGDYVHPCTISKHQLKQLLSSLSYLLRNLLKTRLKSSKSHLLPFLPPLLSHIHTHTWQYLPMFQIFPNMFLCCGRKQTLNYMHIFLEVIQQLGISYINYRDQGLTRIVEILQEIYGNCQCYLSQDEMRSVRGLWVGYGVGEIVGVGGDEDI